MAGVRWVLQSTYLGDAPTDWAAALAGIGVTNVILLPVSIEDAALPPLPDHDGPTVFFGSSWLKVLAADSTFVPGVWFPQPNFHAGTIAQHWGGHMLNDRHWIGALADSLAPAAGFDRGAGVFLRPATNLKLVKGSVVSMAELRTLIDRTSPTSDRRHQLTLASEVLVATPQALRAEWRCFVAGGRVIAASQYLLGGIVTITRPGVQIPDFDAIYRAILDRWTPAPLFSLDITQLEDGRYRIVEVNCFNSSGLYGCDPRLVFAAANRQARRDWDGPPRPMPGNRP